MILFIRVEEEETIGIIAAKYKTTVEDILVLNKVNHPRYSRNREPIYIQGLCTKIYSRILLKNMFEDRAKKYIQGSCTKIYSRIVHKNIFKGSYTKRCSRIVHKNIFKDRAQKYIQGS